MAVLMPDGTYQLFRVTPTLDAHLRPVRDYKDDTTPDWTGNGRRNLLENTPARPNSPAGRTFDVALEPEAWPVGYRDKVVLPDGQECTVELFTIEGSQELDPTHELWPVTYVHLVVRPITQAQLG